MTRPDWVASWLRVSMREFYEAVGQSSASPSVRGRYSDDDYGTDFVEPFPPRVIGRTLRFGESSDYKPDTEYYLPREKAAA